MKILSLKCVGLTWNDFPLWLNEWQSWCCFVLISEHCLEFYLHSVYFSTTFSNLWSWDFCFFLSLSVLKNVLCSGSLLFGKFFRYQRMCLEACPPIKPNTHSQFWLVYVCLCCFWNTVQKWLQHLWQRIMWTPKCLFRGHFWWYILWWMVGRHFISSVIKWCEVWFMCWL